MSDSEGSFDILKDIMPYSFEPLAKRVTHSINCEELAAASTYVDPEQPPVPGLQQKLDWCLFVTFTWYTLNWYVSTLGLNASIFILQSHNFI